MAFFAEINENNIVIRVISLDDIHESDGSNWCNKNLGGVWVETSYTNRIRKQYAGIGFVYDETADEFVSPSPFPSWSLDVNNDWQAPTPKPEGNYYWDEESLSWIPIIDGEEPTDEFVN